MTILGDIIYYAMAKLRKTENKKFFYFLRVT
jgi:hypothetical protein